MRRYFFHIRTQDGLLRDEEGAAFEDFAGAQEEALRSVKAAIAESMRRGETLSQALNRSFEIADETGEVIATIPFKDAAEVADYAP